MKKIDFTIQKLKEACNMASIQIKVYNDMDNYLLTAEIDNCKNITIKIRYDNVCNDMNFSYEAAQKLADWIKSFEEEE